MNPNFRELSETAFLEDGNVNPAIDSCLCCRYFVSYRNHQKDPEAHEYFGICLFPMMIIDETVGLGLICDFFARESE